MITITLDEIILLLLNGIFFSLSLFIISLGLTLIFGVLGILNIAHGGFYALGAYFAVSLVGQFLGFPTPTLPYIALFVAALFVGIVGLGTEPILRPIYKREVEYQLLLTYGIFLIIQDAIKFFWGLLPVSASEPYLLLGKIEVCGRIYPLYNIFVMIISTISALALYYILYKTDFGRLVRATAMDKEMAIALGIDAKKIYMFVFALGCFLAGLAGSIVAPMIAVQPGIGSEETTLAFAIIAIGGLGSLKGALLGSFIVGMLRSVGVTFFPEIELAVIYLVMFVVLTVRPHGLFGKIEKRV